MTDSEMFIKFALPKLEEIENQLEEKKQSELNKFDMEWAKAVFEREKGAR